MTDLKRKIESCSTCAGFHHAFKLTFCELVKKLNPDVNKNTCYALIDELFLERKITKEELAKRLGISLEDAEVIFKKALELVTKEFNKVLSEKGKKIKI